MGEDFMKYLMLAIAIMITVTCVSVTIKERDFHIEKEIENDE